MDDDDSDGFGERPCEAAPIFERPTNNSFSSSSLQLDRDLNFAVERQLADALRIHSRNVFEQPWERSNLQVQGNLATSCLENLFRLNRLVPKIPELIQEIPAQTFLAGTLGKSFSYVTRKLPTMTWPEAKLARKDRAYKLWRLILEENAMATLLGIQIQEAVLNLASEEAITAIISDTFQDRAPATLAKRGSAFVKFMVYSRAQYGVPGLPILEARAYKYIRAMIEAKAAPTAPAGFVSALGFASELLKAEGAAEAASSSRIKGAAQSHYSKKRFLKQAKILETMWVKILENAVYDSLDEKDKVAAGFFCYLTHARPRYADAMFAERLVLDVDQTGAGFVEGEASGVKTARSAQLRTQLMPLVAPAWGIAERPWAVQWFKVRSEQKIDKFKHVLPSVGMDGNWIDYPCDLGIANKWLVSILCSFGISPDLLDGVSSQGCKATSLSWAAKFNLPVTSRQLLGRHIPSHLTSAMTYSRDCLAGPLREYDDVLLQIRSGEFLPDCSRSGRFKESRVVKFGPSETEGVSERRVDGGVIWNLEENKLVSTEDSSDSSSSSTESSDDSENSDHDVIAIQALQKPRPSECLLPPDTRLYLCRASRLLHIRGKRGLDSESGVASYRLRCGKVLSGGFRLADESKVATYSKCVTCFSAYA